MNQEKTVWFQPYTKDYSSLGNAESGRNRPQGRAHQLVSQYQTVTPEDMHTSDTIQTEQIAFKNICV